MDNITLTADINAAVALLNNLSAVFPSIAWLSRYGQILANVAEEPIILSMLVAAVNSMAQANTTMNRVNTASRHLGRVPIIKGIGSSEESVYIHEQTL